MQPTLFLPTLSVLLIITLIHLPKSSCLDQKHVTCGEPYQCGNINLIYPFWGGDRPETCGYPGFEVSCHQNVPRISAESVIYRIIAPVDTTNHTLTVVRDDLLSDICPRFLRNTTLNFNIFRYSNIVNITLYYNCTAPAKFLHTANQFSCTVNSTTSTANFFTTSTAANTDISFPDQVRCTDQISVPINQAAVQSLESTKALKAALNAGFSLQYEANNSICSSCNLSGGRCGYNTDSNSFACYCSDKANDLVCYGGDGMFSSSL